jgi:two-component system sensor histidine kinase YesM
LGSAKWPKGFVGLLSNTSLLTSLEKEGVQLQRTFHAMSIKSKVTLAFIFFILIPFSVLGLYTYNQSQRFIQAQLIANSQTTVKQIKYTIESKIDLIESVSNNITYNYRFQQFLGEPYSLENDSLDTYFSYAAPLVNYAM